MKRKSNYIRIEYSQRNEKRGHNSLVNNIVCRILRTMKEIKL